jgi:uncharacterized protein YggE
VSQENPGAFGKPYWIDLPVIEVLGRADMQVKPNRAAFSVGFKEVAKDAETATKAAVERAQAADKAMRNIAGEALSVTSSVSLVALYEQYETEDNRIVENRRADKIEGYEAKVTVYATVDNLAISSRTRAAALALGPENSSYFSTSLQRTSDLLIEAEKAAIQDARKRANMMADAAGVSLGKLLVVQEGNGPCLGEWSNGSGNYFPAYAPPPPPPPPPSPMMQNGTTRVLSVTPDEIDALDLPMDPPTVSLSASVCMVYAIK